MKFIKLNSITSGGGTIKSKLTKIALLAVAFGVIMPNNMFTYATTDISYVESVSSTIETPEIELTSVENRMITLEDNNDNILNILEDNNKPEDNIVLEETLCEINDIKIKAEEIAVAIDEYKPVINNVDQSDALLITENPDENYCGSVVELLPEDRELLERLVQGEAGGEGYEGAALVAQAIRDAIVYRGYNSVAEVREALKYTGSLDTEPNQNVKNAVAYIFDDGGIAVKHKIFYFYAPAVCESSFHESQKFIIEHKGHRFFGCN